MQIHELNGYTGALDDAYMAVDNGSDTGKKKIKDITDPLNARIDNIIAGPASSAEEVIDARLGANGVTYPSLGVAIRDQITDTQDNINEIATVKTNYYDGQYDVGYIVTNGSVNYDPIYTCSKMQRLNAGTYLIRCLVGTFGSNAYRCYRYQSDGTFIDFINATQVSGDIYKFTLNQPYYCRFNIGNGQEPSSYMIIRGDTIDDYPLNYIPYGTSAVVINPNITLPTILTGKKLCCDGDSIMYGAGYAGGFAGIIAQRNNMTLQNIAVSGATIRTGTTWPGGSDRHWISDSLAGLDADGDYYIFDGIVNDINSQTTLGAITWGYTAALDTTTYCGAFEKCCKTLAIIFKGKKVGYIFPHRIWQTSDTLANSFYDASIQILKKWGIPYIDLRNEIPSLNLIDDLKTNYTNGGDGWHPNEQGYKLYYADKIEAWLKTL